jgi:hypothetical protein
MNHLEDVGRERFASEASGNEEFHSAPDGASGQARE